MSKSKEESLKSLSLPSNLPRIEVVYTDPRGKSTDIHAYMERLHSELADSMDSTYKLNNEVELLKDEIRTLVLANKELTRQLQEKEMWLSHD